MPTSTPYANAGSPAFSESQMIRACGIGACLFTGWRNHKKRKAEREEAIED